MFVDQLLQFVVHHGADDIGRKGRHIVRRAYDLQIQDLLGTGLDEGDRPRLSPFVETYEILRDLLDGSHGGGEADAGEIGLAVVLKHLEGQGQERPPLGIAYVVDLVEDDPFHLLDGLLELRRCEDQGHRLGGGDEDVRGMADHLLPLVLRGVPGTYGHRDLGDGHAFAGCEFLHLLQRFVEIPVHIVGQGLERRDVDAIDPFLEGPLGGVFDQLIENTGEGGEGLTGSCRGRDKYAFPLMDDRDGHRLRFRKGGEPLSEPFGNKRLHHVEDLVHRILPVYLLQYLTAEQRLIRNPY